MIKDQKQLALDSAKKALKDCRSIAALLQIDEVKTRVDRNGKENPRYHTKDEKPITTLDEIIGLMTIDDVEFSYPKVRTERFANSLMGCRIKLKNVFLLVTETYGDEELSYKLGKGWFNLTLVLTPYQDNDKDIPLKVAYIDFEYTDAMDKEYVKPKYLTLQPVEQIKKPRY